MSDGLPKGWHTALLSKLARVVSGGTPSRDVPSYWGGDIPWVTPTDITRTHGRYLSATQEHITQSGLGACSATLLPPGSILMTSRATVGESRIAGTEVCTNQGFKSLVPANGTNGHFLYYQMQRLRETYKAFGIGSTFLEVSKRDTERFAVPIPADEREQRLIAAVLDAVDVAIEKTEALIAKYQQIKAGLMHDLFTRGVTADGKLRPPRQQAPELYQETPIGWIPKEWQVLRMVDLAEDRSGSTTIGPFGSDLVASDYRLEGVPVIFVRDVKEAGFEWNSNTYISNQKALQLSAHVVKPGDILATKMGLPPCISCLYPDWMPNGVITADMIRLTPDATAIDGYWLTNAINHDRVRRQVAAITAGVTRPKVTLTDFRNIKIARPKLLEQKLVSVKLIAAQDLIDAELAQSHQLQNQKLGLMHDLLTGKVRVPLDTPAPEPAHV